MEAAENEAKLVLETTRKSRMDILKKKFKIDGQGHIVKDENGKPVLNNWEIKIFD